jgi:hypothetical protein
MSSEMSKKVKEAMIKKKPEYSLLRAFLIENGKFGDGRITIRSSWRWDSGWRGTAPFAFS